MADFITATMIMDDETMTNVNKADTSPQCVLPEEVRDLSGYPLYLLIAAWGFRMQQVLTSSVVSRVFLITQGQARDALHYIRYEGRQRVSSESVPICDGINPFCKALRILSVEVSEIPEGGWRRTVNMTVANPIRPARIPDRTAAQEAQRRLRQWMVSRRPGERVPSSLLVGGPEREQVVS